MSSTNWCELVESSVPPIKQGAGGKREPGAPPTGGKAAFAQPLTTAIETDLAFCDSIEWPTQAPGAPPADEKPKAKPKAKPKTKAKPKKAAAPRTRKAATPAKPRKTAPATTTAAASSSAPKPKKPPAKAEPAKSKPPEMPCYAIGKCRVPYDVVDRACGTGGLNRHNSVLSFNGRRGGHPFTPAQAQLMAALLAAVVEECAEAVAAEQRVDAQPVNEIEFDLATGRLGLRSFNEVVSPEIAGRCSMNLGGLLLGINSRMPPAREYAFPEFTGDDALLERINAGLKKVVESELRARGYAPVVLLGKRKPERGLAGEAKKSKR